MDIISHFLWTYALLFKTKYKLKAAIFGVLPDILAFGAYFIYNIFTLSFHFGKPELSSIPNYVFIVYSFTHSLVIFFAVMFLIYLITKKIYFYMFGWLVHILIDIPSHTRDFFPTPFLWPISNFHVSGVSWANPIYMIVNYSLLCLIYGYLFINFRKKNKKRH